MTVIYNFYNQGSKWAEGHINAWIPTAPKDAVHAMVESFALSFSVSLLLSGGDLNKAALSGAFAIVASLTQVAGMALLQGVLDWGNKAFGKSLSLDPEGRHLAFMAAFASSLYLGQNFGLNNKATVLTTVPLRVWDIFQRNTEKTTRFGMIVV